MSSDISNGKTPNDVVIVKITVDIALGGVPPEVGSDKVVTGLTRMVEEAWQNRFPSIVPVGYRGEVVRRDPHITA